MRNKTPSWLIDAFIAVVLGLIAVFVERQSAGRLASSTVVLWSGGGSFLLLRIGDWLAQAGRSLGCSFVFAITWLLPCVTFLYIMSSQQMKLVVRNSAPFFFLLGFFLIIIMVVTFERIRVADVARHERWKSSESGNRNR